jgi:hypothetical protein
MAFADEFAFLLSRFEDYARSLRESTAIAHGDAYHGVSDQEPSLVPFWYHCDCGSKAKLFMAGATGSTMRANGACMGCGRRYELGLGAKGDPDLKEIASRISARSIAMNLIFFRGLLPSCYVGGIGGIGYLRQAQHVASRLGIAFPPIAVWRPHDRYLGLGQLEALLQSRRICSDVGASDRPSAIDLLRRRISEIGARLDELEGARARAIERLRANPEDAALREGVKAISLEETRFKRDSNLSLMRRELAVLEVVPDVLDLYASVIDYAVCIGLERTSDQWMRHLNDDGSLSSDVQLDTVLSSDRGQFDGLYSAFGGRSDGLKWRVADSEGDRR